MLPPIRQSNPTIYSHILIYGIEKVMRISRRIVGMGLPLSMLLAVTGAAELPPPAAPASDSPAIDIPAMHIAEELNSNIAKSANPALGRIGITNEYVIHQVHRAAAAPPGKHPGWTELHYVLDGSATFVTGGELNGKPGAAGTTIEGGVARTLHKGDAVIVPPDTPHWYQHVDGAIDVLEVRFISPSASAQKKDR